MSVIVGRSRIATKYGIVAASQPLAARAGVQVLERGGNAVDAAIADQRRHGPGRAAVERHRRRPVRDRLRGEDRQAAWPQRRRLGAGGADAGAAQSRRASPRCRRAASTRSPCPAPSPAGTRCARGSARCRCADLLAPAIFYADEGFPGLGRDRRALGGADRQARARSPTRRATYLPDGRAPRAGEIFRNPDLAGSLRLIADARARPVSTRARPPTRSSRSRSEKGGTMTAADLARVRARMGRSDLDDLSRLDGLRAAAEHAGHRGADDAQPDGAVSARRVRLPQRQGAARDDRGEEARLRRHAALRRRPALREGAGARRC